MMRIDENSIVGKKSYAFAIRIVKLYQYLSIRSEQRETVLSKQLLRSGTSIGANIREALRGQSKADFAAKMNIALKEANETEYWIDLLHDTDYIDDQLAESLLAEVNELNCLLISIVKTSFNNLNNSQQNE